jgi:hypothetical protein
LVIAIYVLIAAAALWFVFRPLFVDRGTLEAASRREGRRRELIEERERILETIRELDFDHRMGKVEEADYTEARGRYEAQAIEVMKAIDRTNGRPDQADVEKQVEAEIAGLRQKGQTSQAKCAKCGAPLAVHAKFCAQCGAQVSRE